MWWIIFIDDQIQSMYQFYKMPLIAAVVLAVTNLIAAIYLTYS